ncbi:phosphoribosylformylglycinamidine cyclo-ligase [Hydrogenobaculum sp. Y04AAS1]|uniref:phosphoribosylformylglycinamidine cyclo-ligase n=1 Tax=Hydrogenobaculum sp. (strain Y04AAS1) TaxID=380749 RepID=UPI00015BCC94|nr:phosphoribosylformylglycinamidine cyclo-ligase [Hydrogenobaculum sp. Y04AAS1]HCT66504.1 phosphoribosylformylglycinamidine cyclo-ligase [Hydrogenobaculum sp.]
MSTYKEAGVDIEKADRFVGFLKERLNNLNKNLKQALPFGAFAAGFLVEDCDLVITSTTDGVGTKLKIAQNVNIHNTVGIDLVAMNVNDIITTGSKPIAFLDYIAIGMIEGSTINPLIEGIITGCEEANTPLVGGETAEMPSFYKDGEYDLAGFCIGICKKDEIVTGQDVKENDIIIAIPSSGFHSNGFSLVRYILEKHNIKYNDYIKEFGKELWEILLTPTRIYVKDVLELKNKIKIKAMAHITGGGIPGNITRVIPYGLRAVISAYPVPDLFLWFQKLGNIKKEEMYKTFNMGVGFMIIIEEKDKEVALNTIKDSFVVGYIEQSKDNSKIVLNDI